MFVCQQDFNLVLGLECYVQPCCRRQDELPALKYGKGVLQVIY